MVQKALTSGERVSPVCRSVSDMTSKAKTGQPLSNYKNAGHAGPEDVTKEVTIAWHAHSCCQHTEACKYAH